MSHTQRYNEASEDCEFAMLSAGDDLGDLVLTPVKVAYHALRVMMYQPVEETANLTKEVWQSEYKSHPPGLCNKLVGATKATASSAGFVGAVAVWQSITLPYTLYKRTKDLF